jgi:hypothetical protein
MAMHVHACHASAFLCYAARALPPSAAWHQPAAPPDEQATAWGRESAPSPRQKRRGTSQEQGKPRHDEGSTRTSGHRMRAINWQPSGAETKKKAIK